MPAATKDTRKPLSLRLPPYELSIIDEFSAERRVSKTDAFLHFLRKGIEANGKVESQLEEIQQSLQKMMRSIPATLTRKEIISTVTQIALDFPAIERVYLFGSFARGDATSASDVDLRLQLSDKVAFSLFDLARFKKTFEQLAGREVDIITAKDIKNSRLQEAIDNERILIYERTEQ